MIDAAAVYMAVVKGDLLEAMRYYTKDVEALRMAEQSNTKLPQHTELM